MRAPENDGTMGPPSGGGAAAGRGRGRGGGRKRALSDIDGPPSGASSAPGSGRGSGRGSGSMAGTPAGMAGGGAGTPASAKRVRNTPVTGLSEAERSSAQLAALAEYLEACGGSASMVDGWYTKTETRSTGSTAGTYDTYFFHPSGKRFRSRAEIARYFELQAAPAPRRSADAQARADAKAALKQEKVEARSAEAAERDAQRQKEIEYARRYPCADALLADDDARAAARRAAAAGAAAGGRRRRAVGGGGRPPPVLALCGERRPRPRGGARARGVGGGARRGSRLGALARDVNEGGDDVSDTLRDLGVILLQVAVHDTGAARWWPSPRLVAGATAAAAAAAAARGAAGARAARAEAGARRGDEAADQDRPAGDPGVDRGGGRRCGGG